MTVVAQRPAWLTWLAALAAVIGFVNFLWYIAEGSTVGDANRGYVDDGHYFFLKAGHAIEVSKETWEWSSIHGASILVTHPLALIGGAYFLLTVVFPSMMGSAQGRDDKVRVERIRGSGQLLATTRTGGKLGDLRLTRPLIGVDVHPGGLVIRPFGMPPIGIDAGKIGPVQFERSRLQGSGVTISHRQIGSPPVRLLLDDGDPIVVALRSIAPGTSERHETSDSPIVVSRQPYSAAMKAMIVIGLVLTIVFAVVTIPFGSQMGPLGPIWAIGLVAIIGYNAWTYLIRNRDRW
jgi:hypothetical protein